MTCIYVPVHNYRTTWYGILIYEKNTKKKTTSYWHIYSGVQGTRYIKCTGILLILTFLENSTVGGIFFPRSIRKSIGACQQDVVQVPILLYHGQNKRQHDNCSVDSSTKQLVFFYVCPNVLNP